MPPPTTFRSLSGIRPAHWWAFLAAGAVYGLFTYLSLPPVGLWPLALIAVVPLVWAGCRADRRPVLAGFLSGLGTLPLWLVEQAWLIDVSAPGYPAVAAYLALYPALFVTMLGWVRGSGWKIPMAAAAPVLWVMLEGLRGELVLTGYAWFLAGHPLIDLQVAAAPAALLGVYVVSFLVAALAGATADASGWAAVPRRAGGMAASVIIGVWALLAMVGDGQGSSADPGGGAAVGSTRPATLRVAVVQTNQPQSNKMRFDPERTLRDFRGFLDLTRQAARGGGPGMGTGGGSGQGSGVAAGTRMMPDVVVWPETMFPGWTLEPDSVETLRRSKLVYPITPGSGIEGVTPDGKVPATLYNEQLLATQREIGVPMIVGAIAIDDLRIREGEGRAEPGPRFNSVYVVSGGAVRGGEGRYDKIDLTPFGEVIPYAWRWPWLQKALLNLGAAGMAFDLTSGASPRVLNIPVASRQGGGAGGASAEQGVGVPVATPVCFEVTRSELCRSLVYEGGVRRAALIVNVSNDGWFGDSRTGRRQHLLAARWRCVELGVPMVRAVNTGYSAFVDTRGQVLPVRLVGTGIGDPQWGVEGVLSGEIALAPTGPESRATLFGRIGNVFAWAMVAAGAVLAAACWFRRRKRVRSGG